MARVAAFVGASSLLAAEAVSSNGKNFLSNMLQPDVAAKSLVAMEEEWQAEAGIFAECEAHGTTEATKECVESSKHFKTSCNKVVDAMLQGSSGDRDSVKQYMDEVCNQDVMQDWHKDRCVSLSGQVNNLMSADSFENRNALKTADFCSKMWKEIVSGEKDRAQKEAEDEAEKAKEDAKVAEEKAEEKKKQQAEEDAAAAAKAKADAEAKAQEQATAAKAAAEKKAEEPAPVALASNATVQAPVQVPVASANNTKATEGKK